MKTTKKKAQLKQAVSNKKKTTNLIGATETDKQIAQREVNQAAQGTVNQRLKELRTLLRRSQIQWAQDLETTQGNISNIENNGMMPTGNFWMKLAERYPEVSFDWLIRNEGTPTKSTTENRMEQDLKYNQELEALKAEIKRLKSHEDTLLDTIQIIRGIKK